MSDNTNEQERSAFPLYAVHADGSITTVPEDAAATVMQLSADNARLRATLDAVRAAVNSGNWTEAKKLLEDKS